MKRAVLAAAAILLTAGAASAAPGWNKGHNGWGNNKGHSASKVSPRERAAITQARAHLAAVKARAWRDGRITTLERFQIRNAENQLQRVILRSRFS